MKRNQLPSSIWKDPIQLLACGLGTGAMPYAPGTFGTLLAVPLYWFMQPLSIVWYVGLTGLLFVVGIWLCGYTANKLGVHDHGGIVWDEVVGYLITMTFAPTGWVWIVLGFLLFRLFDILKPFPVRWLDQHVSGGFGIMVDDVLAGVYAIAGLYVVQISGFL